MRGWFSSTGAPPAWGLVRYMVAGLVAGAVLSGLLPDFRATLLAALAGAVVAASGSAGPSSISRRIALIGAGLAQWAAVHIALGCLGGLLVVFVGTSWRRRGETDDVKAARAPLPLTAMWVAFRSFDEHARDGVRRAIPLAILMFLFQREGGRDAFWIFFAAYIVLLTAGKTAKSLAFVRVGSTLFGVVLLAFASLVVPDRMLFSLGVVILFAGIGLSPPYPIVGGGLTSIGSILLAGAPTGDATSWAGNRLLDTIVGCAIALVATYLLWPRDREADAEEAVPVTAAA